MPVTMNRAYELGSAKEDGQYPPFDLSGKLIIKVQLGDDIRRIPIHNDDITYDELVLMMQRVFRGKLNQNDDVVIKYKDEDADLITIFDSSDLAFAIQCSRILKLTLFVNGRPKPLDSNEIQHIKLELKQIRDKVLTLIDQLEPPPSTASAEMAKEKPPASVTVTGSVAPKEFDPLTANRGTGEEGQEIKESPKDEQRTGTPDSASSRGSGGQRITPANQVLSGATAPQMGYQPGQGHVPMQFPPASQPQTVYQAQAPFPNANLSQQGPQLPPKSSAYAPPPTQQYAGFGPQASGPRPATYTQPASYAPGNANQSYQGGNYQPYAQPQAPGQYGYPAQAPPIS
uniref:PB1 domain-containing protein n=1 Tax=Strigamia maritima TaxID=126957 RepID=T1JAS9_STRMM